MRLVRYESDGELSLTGHYLGEDKIPPYAILSHTWQEGQEVDLNGFIQGTRKDTSGYEKIMFCAQQAKRDGLYYSWVDTCCIDKSSSAELSEAINSMFKWYQAADRCYVYLSDVSSDSSAPTDVPLESSRWFTRGWTLQELLAPELVQFFTKDGILLGDKRSLGQVIARTTGLPLGTLQGQPLTDFSVEERISWTSKRQTKLGEDKAYSLLGILDVKMLSMYSEGEEGAFIRLRRKIKKTQMEKTAIKTVNMHWMVPQSNNSLFTGRTEIINRIRSTFQERGTTNAAQQSRFVITGMGGQGKSELCIKVANSMREEFWGVFWVDVSNPSTAHDGFLSIAKLLRLRAETVKDTLQALSSMSRRWLLVLDNADDPKVDYAAYLPSGNRGAVLMTSRIPEFRMYSTAGSEALEGLDLDHSTQLLLKAAQVPIDSWSSHILQAHEIVQMLGSHTLALIQAGAYVAVGYCQLGQYPKKYRQQRKLLLEHYPSQEQSRYQNVYATFEASMSMLGTAEDEASQDAMDLLSFFSVLHSSVLPQQVFQDAWAGAKLISRRELQMRNAAPCPTVPSHRFHRLRHLWSGNKISLPPKPFETFGNCALGEHHVASLPKFMDPYTENWNNRRLLGASALLVSLSLVARHQTSESVGLSMHPLTHAWAKDRLEKKQQEKAWISSSCLLGLSRNMSWLWRDHERQLRPHLQCLVLPDIDAVFSFESRRVILPILLQCGWLLFSMREYKRLQSLLEGFYHELGITAQDPSDEHMPIWTLASRNELRLHHIKPAITLLEHVVTIDQRMLDPRHPEGLITQYNLARAYSDDGQSEKAIPVLQHVLAIYATLTLDETQSKWQSSTQFELARALIAVGRSNEGTALLEHVVQCQENSSPNSSPEGLLTAQHALATAYNTTKETQKALPLLETIAKAYAATAEESDPDRLSSEYELARAYARNEQLEASLALLEHVVRVQKAVLEEDDYELLASQYMLAQVYNSDKQTTRGKELLQHVVNVYKVLMDESHHILLGAQHDLALAYEDDGEIGEAVSIMERVVERRKGVLEKGHKDLVRSEIALRDLRAGDV